MSLWSQVFNVNIQEKKRKEKKKHLNGKNHLYHHNASVHKILTFLKSDFHFFFSSRFLKQYACVCVCSCRLRLCPTAANTHARTHTHNQHTHTHALQHTPHVLFFFFSGERHGAMERHSSSGVDAPITRRRRGGGGGGIVATATRGLPAHRHSE